MRIPHTFRFSAVALWASSHVLGSDSGTGHVVTPTPIYTPTDPATPQCTEEGAGLFLAEPRPQGPLAKALSEASVTITEGPPALPCSIIAALPTSVHDEFATLEMEWSNWWQSTRSDFSAWASSCTGEFTGGASELTAVFAETSSMDNFTPSATGCRGFVEASATTGPESNTETSPAETNPPGEGSGGRRVAGFGGVVVAAVVCVMVSV